jgi:hypothetical protein
VGRRLPPLDESVTPPVLSMTSAWASNEPPPSLEPRCHNWGVTAPTQCAAKLRDGRTCRSVPTRGDLCEYHTRLAAELGRDTVLNGEHAKKRSARERIPVDAESEPLETRSPASDRPSAVRPALAVTAAEEVETIRRVLLEAATSTSRQSWATCTCPECGKGFRQEISVPDHGARIKAVETLLREGLGRVGEAEVAEPRMPRSVAEVNTLSWEEMKFIFAISYAQAIQAFVDDGDEDLRTEVDRWEPEAREAVGRALAEVA